METEALRRNIFQRLLGICATKQPVNEDCWVFENGRIIVSLARAPELAGRGGAMRLEKKNLPERVLVVHGDDGEYYAFRNRCAHAKRRLDPLPGSQRVQCCSVGKSTFDYEGKRVSGPAKKSIDSYAVSVEGDKLVITL